MQYCLATQKSQRSSHPGEREKRKKGEPVTIQLRQFLQHSGSLTGTEQQGIVEDRLQLLVNITGAFRPGVLAALVGMSGAGKTTLMDVLSGRKTGGIISFVDEGLKKPTTIHMCRGYIQRWHRFQLIATMILFVNSLKNPKQKLHSRTMHSNINVKLWLSPTAPRPTSYLPEAFVAEVMKLVELTPLSGALVGLPGVDGLSTEQRKRLTIAVELVANPSIVFVDEPTSGLDARAAAIVMRTMRDCRVQTG